MDVLFFLRERTQFIRRYYDAGVAPFLEIQRKIDAEEAPFEPVCDDSGEPGYQLEWYDAETAIDVLGHSCVSLLAASLKLYFQTWDRLLMLDQNPEYRKVVAKEKGFVKGYRVALERVIDVDWSTLPVDLDVLEQVVLARNAVQHPDCITTMHVSHGSSGKTAPGHSLFANEVERAVMGVDETSPWLPPTVRVRRENLFRAIDEVEAYAAWLEDPLLDVRYPGRKRSTSVVDPGVWQAADEPVGHTPWRRL